MSLHNIPPVFSQSNVHKEGHKVLTGPVQRLASGRTAKSCKDWTRKGKKFTSFSVCCYVLELASLPLSPQCCTEKKWKQLTAGHHWNQILCNQGLKYKGKAESAPRDYLSASQIAFCKLASNSRCTSSFLAFIPHTKTFFLFLFIGSVPLLSLKSLTYLHRNGQILPTTQNPHA